MKSFRQRVTVTCAASFFVLSMILTTGLVFYVAVQVVREEQHEVLEFSEELQEVLADIDNSVLPDTLADRIDAALELLYDKNEFNLSYVVFDSSGQRVYEFTHLEQSPFLDIPEKPDAFFTRMENYQDWIFYGSAQSERYHTIVASFHHFEFIDHILIGILIELPLALLISVMLGLSISRRVLLPINAIARTARRIEGGELAARIANPGSGDEVEDLVRTLNQTFSELQAAFGRIAQFSADAAHELRTPLTAIRGNLEVCLRQEREAGDYQEAIGMAVEEIARLNQIVDQLLMLSRGPEESPRDDFEPVDLSAVVRNVGSQCAILAESAELQLEMEIADGIEMAGNAALLGQLCYNLIQNAIKFSKTGDSVSLSLRASGDGYELQVRDTGIGIAPEHQATVFERFYQVETSRGKGSGLGLSTVRWIAELHSGSVDLESELGVGTCISVQFSTRAAG
ncbi:MAG: signal transduction histidine kinase [Rhodothermales bacterium]|jgi:signal transduction histidine kinase